MPPFLQTPGVQRPERALTSQCSPGQEERQGEAQGPERRMGTGALPHPALLPHGLLWPPKYSHMLPGTPLPFMVPSSLRNPSPLGAVLGPLGHAFHATYHSPTSSLGAQACEVPDHKAQVLVVCDVMATKQAWGCSGPCRGECACKEGPAGQHEDWCQLPFLPPSHWCFCPLRRQYQFLSLGMRPGFHLDLSELWGMCEGEDGELGSLQERGRELPP